PDPEPYERAAALLELGPEQCLAVEDSPTGSRAAETAGCAVLVVPSTVPVVARPGVVVIESLVGMDVAALRRVHAEALG
ncbi:MAG: HAD-IA family hydrolase, partial [Aldersonia sp.]|nr:HAD-IA family hydrolase [Aldersonia sp.]